MSDNPKVPSAWQLEHAVSAWQQLREIYAGDPALADDEDVIRERLADLGITSPEVLLERAIDAVVWAERREGEADELRRAMAARRDRYAARADQIRQIVAQLLEALDMRSRRAKWGTATMSAGVPALVLTDEALVPDEYWRVERKLQRAPLIDDLKQGVVIPGAVLGNPVPRLSIRKV